MSDILENIKAKNYFEIFDLEKEFLIDEVKLEKNYFTLQRKFHPDKIMDNNLTPASAIDISILLNKSYEILKDKLKRAEYLLNLEQVFISEESKKRILPSQELLQEIMNFRSEIETNTDQLEQINQELKVKFKQMLKNFAANFKLQYFDKAAENIIAAKYYKKALEQVKLGMKRNGSSAN